MRPSLDTAIEARDAYIQYFHAILDDRDLDSAVFGDPTTGLELIICRNTLAIRHLFTSPSSHPLVPPPPTSSGSRPLPTTPSRPRLEVLNSSQQYGSDLDDETLTQLQPSPHRDETSEPDPRVERGIVVEGPTASSLAPPDGIHSVTNRNRRKERQRAQKRQRQLERVRTGRVIKSSSRLQRRGTRSTQLVSAERISDSDEEADGELSKDEIDDDVVEGDPADESPAEDTPVEDDEAAEREVAPPKAAQQEGMKKAAAKQEGAEEEVADSEAGEDRELVPSQVVPRETRAPPRTSPPSSRAEPEAPSRRPSLQLKDFPQLSLYTSPADVEAWFNTVEVCKEDETCAVSARLSSRMQQKMLEAAFAIAGPKSAEDWQTYLATWRKSGWLASRPSSRQLDPIQHLQPYPTAIQHFYHTYSRVETSMVTDSWRTITHRFGMVELWQAYLHACTVVTVEALPPGLERQKPDSRYRRYLFNVLHPELRGLTGPEPDQAIRKPLKAFQERLAFAKRWYTLQEVLGPGIFGLIPDRVVSNNWIQKTLKRDEFAVWLQVIQRWNPACIAAGQHWWKTLNKALSHQKPPRRIKQLETLSVASLKRFHDPTTLFGPGQTETDVSEDEPLDRPDREALDVEAWSGDLSDLIGDGRPVLFSPGFNLEDLELEGIYHDLVIPSSQLTGSQ